jgi:hypothetical protein
LIALWTVLVFVSGHYFVQACMVPMGEVGSARIRVCITSMVKEHESPDPSKPASILTCALCVVADRTLVSLWPCRNNIRYQKTLRVRDESVATAIANRPFVTVIMHLDLFVKIPRGAARRKSGSGTLISRLSRARTRPTRLLSAERRTILFGTRSG